MSGRGTHHAGGLVAGLLVGQIGVTTAGWSLGEVIVLAGVSCLTAGGELSCDMDNHRWWKRLDKWLPDEWLGNGGPLQHRGLTHWWGTVALMGVGWLLLFQAVPPLARLWPVAVGQVTGWLSHLALDFVCGKQVRSPDGYVIVRAGIPMMPWWSHAGGLIRSGDIGSQTIGILLGIVAVGQVWMLWSVGTL